MTSTKRICVNLEAIRSRMALAARRRGRTPSDITLIAVTKKVGAKEAQALAALGVMDFGENRVPELLRKCEALAHGQVRWHMIGRLQTNKVNKLVGNTHLIHSVDSVRLAEAISKSSLNAQRMSDILLQVNVSGEAAKTGFRPDELDQILARVTALEHVTIRGLMTMAPFQSDPEQTRPVFRKLRELREHFVRDVPTLTHLSMGMTQDFEIAIEEGATLIRIGTALFEEE
jgi:PLP dependent protein